MVFTNVTRRRFTARVWIVVLSFGMAVGSASAQTSPFAQAAYSALSDQYKFWRCYGKFSNPELNNLPEPMKLSAGITIDFLLLFGKDPLDAVTFEFTGDMDREAKRIAAQLHQISSSFVSGIDAEVIRKCDQLAYSLGFDAYGARTIPSEKTDIFRRIAKEKGRLLGVWKECKDKLQYSTQINQILNQIAPSVWAAHRNNLELHGRSVLREFRFDAVGASVNGDQEFKRVLESIPSFEISSFCLKVFR